MSKLRKRQTMWDNVKVWELIMIALVITFGSIYMTATLHFKTASSLAALELCLAEYGISAVKDTQKLIIIKQDELIKHRNADIYNEISMIENRRPYAEEMIPTTRQECSGECHITEEER